MTSLPGCHIFFFTITQFAISLTKAQSMLLYYSLLTYRVLYRNHALKTHCEYDLIVTESMKRELQVLKSTIFQNFLSSCFFFLLWQIKAKIRWNSGTIYKKWNERFSYLLTINSKMMDHYNRDSVRRFAT